MSAVQHSDEHRVTVLARGFREELSHVSAVPLWSMPAGEAGDVLVLLTQVRSQVDALQMRVLRHAETVGTGSDAGATSTSWWATPDAYDACGGAPHRAVSRPCSSGTRTLRALWPAVTCAPTRRG